MILQVGPAFLRDLEIARSDITTFDVAFLLKLIQKPARRSQTEGDTFQSHILIDRSRWKSEAMTGKESQYLAFSGLFRHHQTVKPSDVYSHRIGANGQKYSQTSVHLPDWIEKWTTFNMKQLMGKVTTANRSHGVDSAENQTGPEWDRFCGRADPAMKPHDRGRINTRRPQKHTEPTQNHVAAPEVRAA